MKGLKVTIDKVGSVVKSIEGLGNKRVMVGVPSSEDAREPDPTTGVRSPINNAGLAYIHTNGSPEANIPARPFLLPGVKNAESQINQQLSAAGKHALEGNTAARDKALNATGLVAVSAVKSKLVNGPFVPLAPATIRERQAKGRSGDKPLIDTAQLLNAQNYVIRDRK